MLYLYNVNDILENYFLLIFNLYLYHSCSEMVLTEKEKAGAETLLGLLPVSDLHLQIRPRSGITQDEVR